MRIGVSTACLFPALTEQALDQLLDLGVKTVEVFLNSPSERSPAFARQLRAAADAAGAQIVSVHPYSSEYEGVSFFGRYPRRFDDAAEDYRRYFEFCGIVGADIVAFHGARSFLPIGQALYFERFLRLRDIARGFGVRLCQENVVRFHSADPAFILAMRREIPDADLLFDVKQAVRAGVDPFDMLEAMGENIRHIHLSDHDGERDCILPGKGRLDHARMVRRLKESGYGAAVMIELYRHGFESLQELAECEKFLSTLFQIC